MRGSMNFSNDDSKINHLFYQAQFAAESETEEQLVHELKQIYDQVSFREFVGKFIECLKLCLIHPEDTSAVSHVLNFAARFTASINYSGVDEDETCPFLKKILEFVCENHGCNNHFVRSRICLFVDKLLCKLGNEVVIDEVLYNKLVDSMLERMKDKLPGIRVRAISAVYRLQDPYDTNCPVVKALLFHLSMDPSTEARRAILRKLAVAAHTLPTIVERIYDIKEYVRKDAFLVLSKCSMSRFTIKQRQMLLYSGLKDRDDRVSKCVEKLLLPLWFDHAKNDFVTMLRSLDVETSSETSYLVLQILFKNSTPQTILDQIKSSLDEDKLIPHDKLTPENAFFWRCAVEYFHHLEETKINEEEESWIQLSLPELTPLTNYIREYFLSPSLDNKHFEFWEKKQRQFILLQLLQLCNVHDFSDELGRSQLKQLCTDLLLSSRTKKDAVPTIVEIFGRILPDVDSFLLALIEIIMDLKEPFKEDDVENSGEDSEEEGKENEISKIDPQIVEKCLTIVVEFLQSKKVVTFNPCLRSLVTTFICPALEAPDTESRVLALHALSNCCLLDVDLAKQYFLLFCFQVANDDMCLVALKGIFDLLLYYGLQTFNLNQDIDEKNEENKRDSEPEKKKRKLKGTMPDENSFVSNSGDDSVTDISSNLSNQSANLITMLMSLLESGSSNIRNVTVEGLCKLLIGSRISSVNLLSKLIIMWFSPLSEEDYVLRQQLGTFFNVYASSHPGSQYMFQQAFLPTIRALFDAPINSPLHEIDPEDVAKLLINLMLIRAKKEKGVNPHNTLSVEICKEILATYSANLGNVPVLVRSLLPLQLTFDDPEFIAELTQLCVKILELLTNANNKLLAKNVQKILFRLELIEAEQKMRPSDVNNTEQTCDVGTDSTTMNATSNLNNDDDSAALRESSVSNPQKEKNSSQVSNNAEVKNNSESNLIKTDDSCEVMSIHEENLAVKENSNSSNEKEYTLTRVNLKRKQAQNTVESSKTAESLEKTEEESKKATRLRSDSESKSTRLRSKSRQGSDVKLSPAKENKASPTKSKKLMDVESSPLKNKSSDPEASSCKKSSKMSQIGSRSRKVIDENLKRNSQPNPQNLINGETPSKKFRITPRKMKSMKSSSVDDSIDTDFQSDEKPFSEENNSKESNVEDKAILPSPKESSFVPKSAKKVSYTPMKRVRTKMDEPSKVELRKSSNSNGNSSEDSRSPEKSKWCDTSIEQESDSKRITRASGSHTRSATSINNLEKPLTSLSSDKKLSPAKENKASPTKSKKLVDLESSPLKNKSSDPEVSSSKKSSKMSQIGLRSRKVIDENLKRNSQPNPQNLINGESPSKKFRITPRKMKSMKSSSVDDSIDTDFQSDEKPFSEENNSKESNVEDKAILPSPKESSFVPKSAKKVSYTPMKRVRAKIDEPNKVELRKSSNSDGNSSEDSRSPEKSKLSDTSIEQKSDSKRITRASGSHTRSATSINNLGKPLTSLSSDKKLSPAKGNKASPIKSKKLVDFESSPLKNKSSDPEVSSSKKSSKMSQIGLRSRKVIDENLKRNSQPNPQNLINGESPSKKIKITPRKMKSMKSSSVDDSIDTDFQSDEKPFSEENNSKESNVEDKAILPSPKESSFVPKSAKKVSYTPMKRVRAKIDEPNKVELRKSSNSDGNSSEDSCSPEKSKLSDTSIEQKSDSKRITRASGSHTRSATSINNLGKPLTSLSSDKKLSPAKGNKASPIKSKKLVDFESSPLKNKSSDPEVSSSKKSSKMSQIGLRSRKVIDENLKRNSQPNPQNLINGESPSKKIRITPRKMKSMKSSSVDDSIDTDFQSDEKPFSEENNSKESNVEDKAILPSPKESSFVPKSAKKVSYTPMKRVRAKMDEPNKVELRKSSNSDGNSSKDSRSPEKSKLCDTSIEQESDSKRITRASGSLSSDKIRRSSLRIMKIKSTDSEPSILSRRSLNVKRSYSIKSPSKLSLRKN